MTTSCMRVYILCITRCHANIMTCTRDILNILYKYIFNSVRTQLQRNSILLYAHIILQVRPSQRRIDCKKESFEFVYYIPNAHIIQY